MSKIKTGGLDHGTEPCEQQQSGTAGVEGVIEHQIIIIIIWAPAMFAKQVLFLSASVCQSVYPSVCLCVQKFINYRSQIDDNLVWMEYCYNAACKWLDFAVTFDLDLRLWELFSYVFSILVVVSQRKPACLYGLILL